MKLEEASSPVCMYVDKIMKLAVNVSHIIILKLSATFSAIDEGIINETISKFPFSRI